MRNFLLIIFLTVISLNPAYSRDGSDSVYVSGWPDFQAESVGIYIENLLTGDVILDVNGELPLVPASVTKMVTAASVLEMCDPQSRFATRFLADGEIVDSILNGNLVVEASGDPTFESAYFPDYAGVGDSVAVSLKRLGVKEVKGRVVLSVPENLRFSVPDGWKDSDALQPYGAGCHAFNFRDNRMAFSMPGATTDPKTPGITVRRHPARGKGYRIERKHGSDVIHVYAGKNRKINSTIANPRPDSAFVHELISAFECQGISVGGKKLKTSDRQPLLVYMHLSPTFVEILTSMMLRSDNMMAEAMLRQLAPDGTRMEALEKESVFWRDHGVDMHTAVINDGSGLSRLNRVSSYVLADILVWMLDQSRNVDDFISLFPRSGLSGTLRNFHKGSELEGRFVAKTGSLNGVQTYAGYFLSEYGMPTHVVVVMVNDFKGSRSKLKNDIGCLLLEKLL